MDDSKALADPRTYMISYPMQMPAQHVPPGELYMAVLDV